MPTRLSCNRPDQLGRPGAAALPPGTRLGLCQGASTLAPGRLLGPARTGRRSLVPPAADDGPLARPPHVAARRFEFLHGGSTGTASALRPAGAAAEGLRLP